MRLILIFLSLFCVKLFALQGGFDESFYRLNVEQRKLVFIQKMNDLLNVSFDKVQKERAFIEHIFKNHSNKGLRSLNKDEFAKLTNLQEKYRVKNLFDYEGYLERIDTIPKSMAIAQAMVESAIGTSRFAREANNLFGELTWNEKGLIPKQRAEGKTHKIRIFDTLQDSVNSYVLNLNRHFAYENFRKERAIHKKQGKIFSGLDAIHSLEKYAEIKGEYAKIIVSVIEKNDLAPFDLK